MRFRFFTSRTLVCSFLLFITAAIAAADVPRIIHFQGVLTDSTGLPLTGTYEFSFSIYADTTIDPYWTQTGDVEVENGFYEVTLSVTAVDFNVSNYLGVAVGGLSLGPKKLLASAPYALGIADSAVTLGKIDPTGALAGDVLAFDGDSLVWQAIVAGGTGDITAVTTGNGLAGGGSAGDVSVWIDTGGVGTMEIADGTILADKIAPAQVVKSVNSITDAVHLVAGSQVSLLESGDSIIVSASISGGGADGDWTISGDDIYSQVSGNVGVGVPSPGEKLDVSGKIQTNSQFVSTVATGTAPLQVSSSTHVPNLNADLLDGEHASDFAALSHSHDGSEILTGTIPFERLPVDTSSTTVAQGDHTHPAMSDSDWTVSGDTVYIPSGMVGIGTSSPLFTLDIETPSAGLCLNTTDSGDPRVAFQTSGTNRFTAGVDVSDAFKFKIGTGAVSTNTRLTIDATGRVGIGTSSPSRLLHLSSSDAADGIDIDNIAANGDPQVRFQLDGSTIFSVGVDDGDGDKFKISTTAVGTNTRFAIDGDGDVGIGTVSPSRRLDISSSGTSDGIDINNIASDGDPELRFQLTGSTKYTLGVDDGDSDKFKIGTSAVGTNTRMTIDGSGNVGIGTSDPDVKLHLSGGTDVTGAGGGFLLLGNASGTGIRIDDNEIQSFTSGSSSGATLYLQREGDGQLDVGNGVLVVDSWGSVGIGVDPNWPGGLYIDDDGGLAQYALYANGTATNAWSGLAFLGSDSALGSGSVLLSMSVGGASPADSRFISAVRGGDVKFRVDSDGDVFADGAFSGGGADFAEMFRASPKVEPGDVLVIDPNEPGSLRKSSTARSRLVAGIHSTRPGFVASKRTWDERGGGEKVLLDREMVPLRSLRLEDMAADYGEVPVAVVGRVPCKASAENGPIRVGDLLVTSSTPGRAMRDDDPKAGMVLGKALEPLPSGTGVIEVLVTLQ